MDTAANLRTETLLDEVAWFLFLPHDWKEARARRYEEREAERHRKGLTPRPVRILAPAPPAPPVAAGTPAPPKVHRVGLDTMELHVRLHAARKERKLSQAEVGRLFGVGQQIVARWEVGPEKGKAIPEDVRPSMREWIEKGTPPSAEELARLAARNRKRKAPDASR